MDVSLASTRGGTFTFTSDKQSLLSARKLVATLPTFLTDCLLRTDSDASVKLFPRDWIGIVTDGSLFLWHFTFANENSVASSSPCRQFELPSDQNASTDAVSISCFETDGRPRLCAAVASDTLRVWPRGVFGAVGRSHIVYDCVDTRLSSLKSGEYCVALEEGPCNGTFLLATSLGRIFGVDARTPQEQVYVFLVSDGVGPNSVNTPVYQASISEDPANSSILSGLGRRVSSIWSFATSKVPVLNVSSLMSSNGISPTGRVLRFISMSTSPGNCRMFLLTESRLVVWDVDSDFEYTVLLCLDLNNDTYGQGLDFAPCSASKASNLWLLCKSREDEESPLSLVSLDVEAPSSGSEESITKTSIVVDTSGDFKLLTSLPGSRVYPCTLVALFSKESGVVYINEALTGRCICQFEFEQPSHLLGVVSAPSDSTALFALVTRQRGIYGVVGEDPCLPALASLQLTTDSLSDPDRLLEALTKITAVLWMGFRDEASELINRLFSGPSQVKNSVLLTAFLRLAKCILNSRPINGLDARWRGVTAGSRITSFDFARGRGDSRFVAKQESMQCLGGSLWPAIVSVASKVTGTTDAETLFSELFPPLISSVVGASGSQYHTLNAFLTGAEVCEAAKVLHSRWCRLKQKDLLKPVFKASVEAALRTGVVDKSTAGNNLLSSEDIFFQTMTLVPHFITNLAERLVSNAKTCLDEEDIESVEFVACTANLLTAGLTEALEYRQKLLPALHTILSEENGANTPTQYDLFCWITENDVIFSQLQEAFDALVELVVTLNSTSDRLLTEGGSLRQECACRSVELATILLQAVYQRVQWCGQSCPSELDACFVKLRTHVISAVAWSIDRPEAGLDLAIRFVDKELILAISEHLDKQTAESGAHPHANLLMALVRSSPEVQLADFALQWHYSHGEKSRLQSLLTALQERESEHAGESTLEQKRPYPALSPVLESTAKRSRTSQSPVAATTAAESCISRFLQRTEARDFAWLHQLGNCDYTQASKGLLASGENEINSLGRRRTLLSLSKLAGIASGQYKPTTLTLTEPQDAETPLVDKYLEVVHYQDALMRRGQLKSDVVLPSHALASLYIVDSEKAADSKENKEDLLLNFSVALRLAQLYLELDEDHLSSEARKEKQEKLVSGIWSQAVKIDSLKSKPDEGTEFNGVCEDSFLYALLDQCFKSNELDESIIPSLSDLLSSISFKHEPWLQVLVENAFNLATKRHNTEIHHPTKSAISMET